MFQQTLGTVGSLENKTVLAVVGALYAVCGVVLVAAYIPQLLSVWRSRNGAADVSLWTWSLWSASATVTLLYANFMARDSGYTMVSIGNLLGCYSITGSILYRRYGGHAPTRAAKELPDVQL